MIRPLTGSAGLGPRPPVADGVPGRGERALEVDVDDRVPLVLGHVRQHPVAEDAGVVDRRRAGRRTRRSPPGRAARRRRSRTRSRRWRSPRLPSPSISATTCCGRREIVAGAVDRAAEVVDHDLGAVAGEAEGVLAADAAAGAGDDRDAAFAEAGHLGAPPIDWSMWPTILGRAWPIPCRHRLVCRARTVASQP